MSDILNELNEAIKSNNEEKMFNNLTNILSQGKDIELDNNNIIKTIILKTSNEKIQKLIIEVIAEWSKIEKNRKLFTDESIIQFLLPFLQNNDEEIVLNTIRALGNICYENDEARSIINENGLHIVLSLLDSDNERPSNSSLTLKASGFLVNLLMSNEELQKISLRCNILNILETLLKKYINSFKQNETLITFLLIILDGVVDYVDDQNISFPESLCLLIMDIFKLSETVEISVACLEILHSQSDKDEIKILLAKNGTCQLIFNLIEKYKSQVNDEESRSVLKMACDMIVIILTGDDCMNYLYDKGKGKVYENMISWLDSDDNDLLSTGILAIGNFARNDVNCTQMVTNGISKKLLDLLTKYNKFDSDIKVQHALLSTLKNLVIPQENKAKILQEGLIDILYPLLKIDQHLVIFKLLGTLRMVIDGQNKAALELLSRKDFIDRLVYWCYNSDHLGVRGEVPRLIAWLIKHSHSFKPFTNIINSGDAVKCLVEMISSNHAVMQNESFYALYLLCLGSQQQSNNNDNDKLNDTEKKDDEKQLLFQQLIDAEIGKNIQFVVNKYSDKMDKHTIENLLTLIEQLITSSHIVNHFKATKVNDALSKLKNNTNAQIICEKLDNILKQLS